MPIPIFERLASHGPGSRAVVDEGGELDYPRLQRAAEGVAGALLARRASLDGERVALWIEPGRRFPVALLGIWRAGGFAVPLALSHPTPELEHVLGDSEASAIVTEASIADRIRPLAVRLGL
ncbi:MAG: AMP-binding protein, partial [Holophagales bacterium]|nr:AMP-binding protein [Holophagales bacterium]